MLKHNIETSHTYVSTADFKITDMNFSNSKRKQKIAKSLWIKPEIYTKCTEEINISEAL